MILAQIMDAGTAWPVAMLVVLLIGLGIGLLNGAVAVLGDIPSFIVTLGMMAVATGLAYVFTVRSRWRS